MDRRFVNTGIISTGTGNHDFTNSDFVADTSSYSGVLGDTIETSEGISVSGRHSRESTGDVVMFEFGSRHQR